MTENSAAIEEAWARNHQELHRNISLANSYRLELSKILLAVTAGIFAFTVAFPPVVEAGTDITQLSV
ncbi:hypothetical protein DL239_14530 [Sedimentitalea sp. CY04]|uniref:Uncharacterized protein n=1 Tax=Parasedimentitalea denitrificans TaxID=2211118 RepID=A0ABX0WBQ4_9RHOB|nr:hypothetical protein [Sedimentitalea sp. CY04]NIZ62194.1 hypothetical protein [Sedimentitalea sp. CY04]